MKHDDATYERKLQLYEEWKYWELRAEQEEAFYKANGFWPWEGLPRVAEAHDKNGPQET